MACIVMRTDEKCILHSRNSQNMWIIYNLIYNYIIITVVTVYYNVYLNLHNFCLVYLQPNNAFQAYHASGHGGLSDSLSHYLL